MRKLTMLSLLVLAGCVDILGPKPVHNVTCRIQTYITQSTYADSVSFTNCSDPSWEGLVIRSKP
jgi:hypothetical protein